MLVRDAALGVALWAGWHTHAALHLAAWAACLAATVLGARWFALDRQWMGAPVPLPWSKAASEAALLFIGGGCVANLLRLGFGLPPWSGQVPP